MKKKVIRALCFSCVSIFVYCWFFLDKSLDAFLLYYSGLVVFVLVQIIFVFSDKKSSWAEVLLEVYFVVTFLLCATLFFVNDLKVRPAVDGQSGMLKFLVMLPLNMFAMFLAIFRLAQKVVLRKCAKIK